jgi:hypothetical protein
MLRVLGPGQRASLSIVDQGPQRRATQMYCRTLIVKSARHRQRANCFRIGCDTRRVFDDHDFPFSAMIRLSSCVQLRIMLIWLGNDSVSLSLIMRKRWPSGVMS